MGVTTTPAATGEPTWGPWLASGDWLEREILASGEAPLPAGNRVNDADSMHARFYNPQLGRFLSTDPSKRSAKPGAPQTLNRYTYVRNNPLLRIDPNGLEDVIIFKTERNPRRDPPDPWGKAASHLSARYSREFGGQYETLNIMIVDVNRVSQVNDVLSSSRDIVKVAFVGHPTSTMIAVGSESASGTNISSAGGRNDVSPQRLNWSNLSSEASIDILGCKAGAGANPIAQDIADASGVTVTAPDANLNFDNKTGQPFIRWWRFGSFKTFEPSPE